jgi:hypothetical protein
MKSAAVWLKLLALCSTVALGGGYVWWSQKTSEEKRVREEAYQRTMLSGSKSKVIVEDAQPYDGNLRPFEEAKGAEDTKDPRTNAAFIPPPSESKKERSMLPSSKIGLVTPPTQEQEEPPAKERTVLPGSKSIDPILSPDHKP